MNNFIYYLIVYMERKNWRFKMNVIDKLNNSYRENRIYYFMVLIFFCVGIALGAFMVKYMNINDSTDLSNYFSSFTRAFLI